MNELKPIKTKKQIAKMNHAGYVATNRNISENYIKLDKGYYSIKELFVYCFNNIFWVNILSLFSKDKNNG